MRVQTVIVCLMLFLTGCGNRNFTNLGNGTGVPSEEIDAFAREHQVTREQARTQILEQMNRETNEGLD